MYGPLPLNLFSHKGRFYICVAAGIGDVLLPLCDVVPTVRLRGAQATERIM